MTLLHGHVHGPADAHGSHDHAVAIGDADPYWIGAGDAYTGLRTSLQLLAGMQLLGLGSGEVADLRRAVLLRVTLLLEEVRDRLNSLEVPSGGRALISDLIICCDALTLAAERERRELADRENTIHQLATQRLLEQSADRLRRCQRYDRGLRFFGSGGCADIEHALSHLQPGGTSHG